MYVAPLQLCSGGFCMPSHDLRAIAAPQPASPETKASHTSAKLAAAQRPVAYLWNGIGDSILALPALRAISRIFAGRVTLVCNRVWPWYGELPLREVTVIPGQRIAGSPPIRVFDVDELQASIGYADLFVSLVTTRSPMLRALIERLCPDRLVAFYSDAQFSVSPSAPHVVDRIFALAQKIDPLLDLDDFSAPPALSDASIKFACDLRQRLPKCARMIAVHADTEATKSWSGGLFAELLKGFLSEHP